MSANSINPKAELEQEPERWLEEHSKNLGALSENESQQEVLLRLLRKYWALKVIFPTMDYSKFSDYLKCDKLKKAITAMNDISSKAKAA